MFFKCSKHEIASLLIVERIYAKLKLDFESFGLFEDDLNFIKDLIYVPGFKDQIDYYNQVAKNFNLDLYI
jgi:hypothetical protein